MSSSSHSATTAEVLSAHEKICPGDLVVLRGPPGASIDDETFWQFVYPGEIGFVLAVVVSQPNKKTLDHLDVAYIVTPTKSGWIWLYKEVREVL